MALEFKNQGEKNMNDIFDFYRTECDESERLSSQAGMLEYLTTMNYIKKFQPMAPKYCTEMENDFGFFERFLKVHLKTCEVRNILGYCEHGLYIGRK